MRCKACLTENSSGAFECSNCGIPFKTGHESQKETLVLEEIAITSNPYEEFMKDAIEKPWSEEEEIAKKKQRKAVKYTAIEIQEQEQKARKEVAVLKKYEQILLSLIYALNQNVEFAAGGVSAHRVKNSAARVWLDCLLYGSEELARKNGIDLSRFPKKPEEKLIIFMEAERNVLPAGVEFLKDMIISLKGSIQEQERVFSGERSIPAVNK